MSAVAYTWAWNTPTTGVAKTVLLALAERAGENFVCSTTSVPRIAAYCRCDVRTVQRNLRRLETEGFIESIPASGKISTFRLCGVKEIEAFSQSDDRPTNGKMPGWQNAGVAKCRGGKMPGWQNAGGAAYIESERAHACADAGASAQARAQKVYSNTNTLNSSNRIYLQEIGGVGERTQLPASTPGDAPRETLPAEASKSSPDATNAPLPPSAPSPSIAGIAEKTPRTSQDAPEPFALESVAIGATNASDARSGASETPKRKPFVKPTVEQVKAYVSEKSLEASVDAEAFWDFYESKGWKVGNQPMKDWQAAVRNWARMDRGLGRGSRSGAGGYSPPGPPLRNMPSSYIRTKEGDEAAKRWDQRADEAIRRACEKYGYDYKTNKKL